MRKIACIDCIQGEIGGNGKREKKSANTDAKSACSGTDVGEVVGPELFVGNRSVHVDCIFHKICKRCAIPPNEPVYLHPGGGFISALVESDFQARFPPRVPCPPPIEASEYYDFNMGVRTKRSVFKNSLAVFNSTVQSNSSHSFFRCCTGMRRVLQGTMRRV